MKNSISTYMTIVRYKFIIACILSIVVTVSVHGQNFCDDQTPVYPASISVERSVFDCSFDITASAFFPKTNSMPTCGLPCHLNLPCYGYCYQWKLFLNNSHINTACSNDDTYTFAGLSSLGEYKVIVLYNRWILCGNVGVCIFHTDVATVNIDESVNCADIDLFHNTPLPFATSREGTLTANCDISNNKTTVFQASELIKLEDGFKSGTGIFTNFRAYIAPCPGSGKKGDDEGNDYITETISEVNPDDEPQPNNINTETDFAIYPNPTSGEFTIQVTGDAEQGTSEVYIYDIFGRLIYNQHINSSTNQHINISQQPKGIYLVKVLSGEKVYIKKLVHQ